MDFIKLQDELKLTHGDHHENMKKVFKKFGDISEENYDFKSISHSTGDANCVCSKRITNIYTVYNKRHDTTLIIGSKCIKKFSTKAVNKFINKANANYKKKKQPLDYCCLCGSDRKLTKNILTEQDGLKKRYHIKCNPYRKKICTSDDCYNFIRGYESWKTKCLPCWRIDK
jgi:hypothetical protein